MRALRLAHHRTSFEKETGAPNALAPVKVNNLTEFDDFPAAERCLP